jgi:hypothetical protein
MSEGDKTPKAPLDLSTMPATLHPITYDHGFYAALIVELRELNAQVAELIELTKTPTKKTTRAKT